LQMQKMTSTLNSFFDATSFTSSRPVFAVPDTYNPLCLGPCNNVQLRLVSIDNWVKTYIRQCLNKECPPAARSPMKPIVCYECQKAILAFTKSSCMQSIYQYQTWKCWAVATSCLLMDTSWCLRVRKTTLKISIHVIWLVTSTQFVSLIQQ